MKPGDRVVIDVRRSLLGSASIVNHLERHLNGMTGTLIRRAWVPLFFRGWLVQMDPTPGLRWLAIHGRMRVREYALRLVEGAR